MLKNPLFWFSQPSIALIKYDLIFAWVLAGMFVFGLILKIMDWFVKNPVWRILINKFANLGLTMGISGLVWFGFRYENTAIFSDRYWVMVIAFISFVWLLFILKYLVFNFGPQKREYDRQTLNSRYMPAARK